MVQKVAVRLRVRGWASPCDDRKTLSLSQPSSEWVPLSIFFEFGKAKAAKEKGWAPPFISCSQDIVGLESPLPLRLLGYGRPLPFIVRKGQARFVYKFNVSCAISSINESSRNTA